MGVTGAIIVGAAVVGASAYQSNQTTKAANAAADSATTNAQNALADQKDYENKTLAQQNAEVSQEAADEKLKANEQIAYSKPGGGGRAGTILTSPLGVSNVAAPTGGKTLLGQ